MKTSIRTAAVLCAALLGLAGAAAAEEPVKPKPSGPLTVPYPNRPSALMAKPALAPDAEALRAKLAKAQTDLLALASQPPPSGISPRDAAALRAAQAEDERLAKLIRAMIDELEGGGSLGDVTQKLSIQVQQATNAVAKAAQTQSKVSKTYYDAQMAIISNLK